MDIGENIRLVADMSKGRTRRHLEHDVPYRYAVHHAVLIIAEAVRHLPVDVKARHPAIPWQDLETVGNCFRDDCFRIDPDVIWTVINIHLPELGQAIARMKLDILQDS